MSEFDRSIEVIADVVYAHRGGSSRSFDLYRSGEANGATVLFINSGGFVSGRLRQCAPTPESGWRFLPPGELTVDAAEAPIPLLAQFSFLPLLARGFTVLDVRHGNPPGSRLDAIVEDVRSAAAFIRARAVDPGSGRDLGIDPGRLGVWGASAGGYLALLLAFGARGGEEGAGPFDVPRFRAAAAYYPAGFDFPADVRQAPEIAEALVALQIDDRRLDALSLKHHISRHAPPTLVVFGTDDYPFITGACEAVCAELGRCGVETRRVAIPGTGHEFVGGSGYSIEHGARAQSELGDWFERHLT